MKKAQKKEITISDKRFVFTGEFTRSREGLANRVMAFGGKVTSAVSGKTDFLVTGVDPGPSKLEKAKTLKIKIMKEEEFLTIIDSFQSEQKPEQNIKRPKRNDSDKRIWTVKYEPQALNDVLGNKSAKEQIVSFLSNAKSGRGILIHGPPGVGKTLSVKLACKELKMKMIEFNASDVRSKGSLVEKVSGFISTGSLFSEKRVLVMDECDGMTGDRGGLAELSQIIRKSKIPVICICNDKQVVRTLNSCCDEITFRKLETRQILSVLKKIIEKEGCPISDQQLIETITLAHNDMRYILNILQGTGKFKKVIQTNLFDDVLSAFRNGKVTDKLNTFFKDYDMIPMMVFENYLRSKENEHSTKEIKINENGNHPLYYGVSAKCIRSSKLKDHFLASEGLSLSELYRNRTDWSLLPAQGFLSTVVPTQNLRLSRRIEFARELGNISKKNKHSRIIDQFHFHILSRIDISEFYFYNLKSIIDSYIQKIKNNEIQSAIDFLKENNLLKSDCDEVIEMFGRVKEIPSISKTAMTRAYKKLERSLPYRCEE